MSIVPNSKIETLDLQGFVKESRTPINFQVLAKTVTASANDISGNTLRMIVYDYRVHELELSPTSTETSVVVNDGDITKSYNVSTGITTVIIAGSATQACAQIKRVYSNYLLVDDTLQEALLTGSFPVILKYDFVS